MNKQKFYKFSQKMTLTTVVISNQLGLPDQQLENLIADNNIELPVVFIQQKDGHRWADVLDRRTISKFFIISDRFADLIKENKFIGYKFVQIKIIGFKRQEVQGYTGLLITGKSGLLSYENTQLIEKETYPGSGRLGKVYKGEEVTDWDGSDFFTPKDTRGAMVTESVKTAVERYRLSNIEFRDLDDIELDEYTFNLIMKRKKTSSKI